jgi:hypothetical protein
MPRAYLNSDFLAKIRANCVSIATTLGAAYTLGGRGADAVPLLMQVLEQTIAT